MSVKSSASSASGLEGQTIDAGRLLLVRVLGEGAYGVVYLAVEQPDNSKGTSSTASPKEYAVKVLPKADSTTLMGECQSREIVAHKIVSGHPSIVSLHEVLEDDQFIYLVMDHCPGGDLYGAVVDRQVFVGNDALLKSVFLQILDAVEWCHDLGIYHRDLKPDNIFVSADCSKVHLGDFGLATDQNLSNNHKCGSSFYMSPECLGEEHNFGPYKSQVSDIWSLGVIFTNMVTGRSPWRKATTEDEHFYRYMCKPDDFIRSVLPMSDAAGEIFKRIFTFNPYRRISLAMLREAVIAIDTFFPSPAEADSAVRNKRVSDLAINKRHIVHAKSTPATPELPQGLVEDFTKVGAYPDDEFLFPSPNPDDDFDTTPMSQPTTPAATVSSSSTLCDSDDVFSEQYAEKLDKAFRDVEHTNVAKTGFTVSSVNHLLERWML